MAAFSCKPFHDQVLEDPPAITVATTSTATTTTGIPISCSSDDTVRFGYNSALDHFHCSPIGNNSMLHFGDGFPTAGTVGSSSDSDMSDFIKAQIANHPRYPNLLSAYIECQKVGAPPEMASLLGEIGRENYYQRSGTEIGVDPELDEFMESYCEVLQRYKEELSKPFDEASAFLSKIESQLSNLCNGDLSISSFLLDYRSDDAVGTSEEELSHGEGEAVECQESSSGGGGGGQVGDEDVKEMLMRKYSGYLSSLRKDFLKKRKKGKLPKDARMTLVDWWNAHYRWPYPTEEEKMKLSEVTGLDQKQINNWFINQRKRHWKPSEDMKVSFLEGLSGNNIAETLYLQTGDTSSGTPNHDNLKHFG